MFKNSIKAWNYAKIAFKNERPEYIRKQQYKSFILTFYNPITSEKWYNILESDRYREILKHRPSLFLKPFKSYISTQLSIEKKIKIICDTYDFIYEYKIDEFLINKNFNVCEFNLKNELTGKLTIGYDDRYRREGELVLSLVIDHLNGVIASICFSLERSENDEWVCRVGCLQGRPWIDDVYITKEAQKLMHGLRPKVFLIEILQEFCRTFNIKYIYAISGKHQAQKRKHIIHIPFLHDLKFSYDNFWKEIGGTISKGNWYSLPLNSPRRSFDTIKSEKRAYYRRRYLMVDFVKESLNSCLKQR